jgi:hypothetical protein
MAKAKPPNDVFISHSHEDAGFAAEIARMLRSYDLKVLTDAEITAGDRIENALWEAIAESQAFVAVIPETEPSASTTFELGAAKAWNKPIYAIASNPSKTQLPVPLQGMVVYPPTRIEEIAQEIKRSSKSLSDEELSVLVDEYNRIDLPVDQLMLQPNDLTKLTKQFQKRTKRQIASEELVRLLLRMRKKGSLHTSKKRGPKAS